MGLDAAAIIIATAALVLPATRQGQGGSGHVHHFHVAGVAHPAAGFMGAIGGTVITKTIVLYQCCDQPGGAESFELAGRWSKAQLSGLYVTDGEGGEAPAQVLPLAVISGSGGADQDDDGLPDPA